MGGEKTLPELDLDSSAHSTGSPAGRVAPGANVTSSPLRSGGGHSAVSPRPRTPVFSLEDALRSNRQVCVSLDEEEFTAVLIDEPITPRTPRSAPARPQSARLVTDCGVTSEIGRRAENQDGWILCDRFAGHDGAVFAAVLDGHGTDGRLIAQFVQDTLPDRLAAQPDMLTDPPAALERAFSETQAALIDPESTLQTDYSGATATCILIVKRRLHVANLGDSRTVMGYRIQGEPGQQGAPAAEVAGAAGARPACELGARRLSNDHKPEAPAERARIEATGGRVCPFELRGKAMGPPRVWRGDEWTPGLAVARSFGDSVAATIGVSAVPEVRSYDLGPDCEFLVLGSDGVWDLIADDEAVRIVMAACARGQTPQEASAELVRTALDALHNARRKDNATALVITIALTRPPEA